MILQSFTQHYNERHYVTLLNLQTTSGFSILLHGIISLPDATSCDKIVSPSFGAAYAASKTCKGKTIYF